MKELKKQASVSVTLALVFTLLISFVLTILEAGRAAAARGYAEGILKTAVQSVLGEFCGPLFEEYNIYAIELQNSAEETGMEGLESRIREYCEYSFNPVKVENHIMNHVTEKGGFNNWNMTIDNCHITDYAHLSDYDGELFAAQAVAYQKYSEGVRLLEKLLDKFKLLGDQQKVSKLLEKKLEVEEELSEIDKKQLRLMELVDGIRFDDDSIELDKNDMPVIRDSFIKKFYTGEKTQTSQGINHDKIYEVLEPAYVNPITYMKTVAKIGKEYAVKHNILDEKLLEQSRIAEELEQVRLEINALTEEAEETGEADAEVTETDTETDTEADAEADTETDAETDEQMDALRSKEAELEEQYSLIEAECTGLRNEVNTLTDMAEYSYGREELHRKNTMNSITEALESISDIKVLQNTLKPSVESYAVLLDKGSAFISDEFSQELKNSLNTMYEYVGIGGTPKVICDIDGIKQTLTKNYALLEKISEISQPAVPEDYSAEGVESWCRRIENISDCYKMYSYENMTFDYSGIKFETAENSMKGSIKKLLSEGLDYLIIDDYEKISDKKLESLPIFDFGIAGEHDKGLGEESLDTMSESDSGREMLDSSNAVSDLSGIDDVIESGADSLLNTFLMLEYIRDHFQHYGMEARADRALDYEQEYIINGEASDEVNLSGVIVRILLLRLITSSLYAFTSRDMKAEATAFATAVVGFTGLPFLVSIVKYFVLFVWAFEQAVIETAAILGGKDVPLLTTEDTFCIKFSEILAFGRDSIRRKADELKSSGICLKYDEYLTLFLLLKDRKTEYGNTMGMIQENIKNKYGSNFSLNSCIVGFNVEMELLLPSRYTKLPFVKEEKIKNISGYKYKISEAAGY